MPAAMHTDTSVAKVVEITSQSTVGFQDAVERGVERAAKTLKNIRSAWIRDQELECNDGKITAYRVIMKVTFVLDE